MTSRRSCVERSSTRSEGSPARSDRTAGSRSTTPPSSTSSDWPVAMPVPRSTCSRARSRWRRRRTSGTSEGRVSPRLEDVEAAAQQRVLAYDRAGDGHYDTVSAFIKSLRGNDPDGALYWLASMIAAGEDPRFIARRLIIAASEDVGNADPRALQVAVAAAQALDHVGLAGGAVRPRPGDDLHRDRAEVEPFRRRPTSPPPRMSSRRARCRSRSTCATPPHRLMKQHGIGVGYRFPHDFEGADVEQQYLPDELLERRYYLPTDQGYEGTIANRMAARAETRAAGKPRKDAEPQADDVRQGRPHAHPRDESQEAGETAEGRRQGLTGRGELTASGPVLVLALALPVALAVVLPLAAALVRPWLLIRGDGRWWRRRRARDRACRRVSRDGARVRARARPRVDGDVAGTKGRVRAATRPPAERSRAAAAAATTPTADRDDPARSSGRSAADSVARRGGEFGTGTGSGITAVTPSGSTVDSADCIASSAAERSGEGGAIRVPSRRVSVRGTPDDVPRRVGDVRRSLDRPGRRPRPARRAWSRGTPAGRPTARTAGRRRPTRPWPGSPARRACAQARDSGGYRRPRRRSARRASRPARRRCRSRAAAPGRPSASMTLPGFTSRWTIPAAWVAVSAAAMSAAIARALGSDTAPSIRSVHERLAIDAVHDDGRRPIVVDDVDDRNDVRVVDACHRSCLST